MSQTLEVLKETIAKITRKSDTEINVTTALKDIKADSLDWVQILVGVEGTLEVEVDVEKVQEMETIGDLVDYLDGLK